MSADYVPLVDRLIADAGALPEAKPHVPLYEYGEVIHILRKKNLMWREVRDWFALRGLDYTPSHYSNAYLKWCAMNPQKADES